MSTPPTEATERVRNLIAFALIFMFISTIPLLVWKTIPSTNEQLLTYILGQLSGMATTALAFYFTTKAGEAALDAKRTENTGRMADAVNSALKAAGTNNAPQIAKEAAEEVAGAAEEAKDKIIGEAGRDA